MMHLGTYLGRRLGSPLARLGTVALRPMSTLRSPRSPFQRPRKQTSSPSTSLEESHPAVQPARIEIFQDRNGYQYFRSRSTPLYQTRRFWIVSGALGTFCTIYYLSHLETVPMSGRTRFIDMTPEQEEQMGREAYHSVIQQYQHKILPWNHPHSVIVRKVAQRIIQVSGMNNVEWEVYVVEDPQRNAFVLPGGKIFVFTGILPIVQGEDGLAAVLGHEMAHQIARHSAEKMSWTKVIFLIRVLMSTFLDTSFLFGQILTTFGIAMPFSRKCETEADYIGLKLMAQACYDPRAAAQMWERMKHSDDSGQSLEYLSTHPNHDTRIKKIIEWLPEAIQIREAADCETTSSFYNMFRNRRF
ncbi:peptidase family M48-domain-containing protein [Polychytrium aggregatum]|uniref:peptidase family M48-domain-containing protein n=1 Tax=Polychytrium aggregatum TaxID=110093 RepID=UPI0022FE44A5|nr:peptidase family M48-domain-containing protein [Polychytrium aggregatum]KAI9209631.1 peptidase family M48-domain-containing protein [Polychytrium aggregatum]